MTLWTSHHDDEGVRANGWPITIHRPRRALEPCFEAAYHVVMMDAARTPRTPMLADILRVESTSIENKGCDALRHELSTLCPLELCFVRGKAEWLGALDEVGDGL